MINSSSPFSRSQLNDKSSTTYSTSLQGEDYPSVSGHFEFAPTNERYLQLQEGNETSFHNRSNTDSGANSLERSFGGLSINTSSFTTADDINTQFPTNNNKIREQQYDFIPSPSTHAALPTSLRSSSSSHYSGINNIHIRNSSNSNNNNGSSPNNKGYIPLRKSIEPNPTHRSITPTTPSSSMGSCPVSPIRRDPTNFAFEPSSSNSVGSGLVNTPKRSSTVGFAHHFSTPTSSYVQSASEKGIPLCKIHQLPVDILCKDCSELICAKCSRSSIHNSHNCQIIDEMDRDGECRDIRSTVEMLDSRVSKLEQCCGTPYEMNLLSRQHEEMVDEIRRDFEKARQLLHKKEQQLIDSLSMIVQSRIQFSQDVNMTKKKLEDAGSMYPTSSISNYDIAHNKYSTVSNLKEKVEFLEIKLKFNGSCIEQDGKELQQNSNELSLKISELNQQYFDLKSYPYYNTLKTNYKE